MPVYLRLIISTAPISIMQCPRNVRQFGSYRWFQYPVQFGDPDLSLFYLFVSFKIPSILHKLELVMQKQIEIFTDGSCLGNPGAGGIGIVLRYKQHEKHISKGYFKTTNNRMELRAVIEALNSLKEPCHVTLYSDSQYMKNGITQWIYNWKKTIGKPVRAKQ